MFIELKAGDFVSIHPHIKIGLVFETTNLLEYKYYNILYFCRFRGGGGCVDKLSVYSKDLALINAKKVKYPPLGFQFLYIICRLNRSRPI